jgi:hypothetical protein
MSGEELRRLPDPDQESVRLMLTEVTRATLLALLRVALELPRGAAVIDHLGDEPWGELEELRRRVYRPLEGSPPPDDGEAVTVSGPDVSPVRSVLDGLAEGYAGGTPWAPLTDDERAAAERLVAALNG